MRSLTGTMGAVCISLTVYIFATKMRFSSTLFFCVILFPENNVTIANSIGLKGFLCPSEFYELKTIFSPSVFVGETLGAPTVEFHLGPHLCLNARNKIRS